MTRLCLLWHFHQPDYRDPQTGAPVLPWVRHHALRGYRDLPLAIAEHGASMAINLVPTLVEQVAWYAGNSGKTLQAAGGKAANDWGIKDMHGSVYEWVHDNFQFDLGPSAVTDPIGAASGNYGRVLRGGSVKVAPKFIRSGARYLYTQPNERFDMHGFRCVRTVK